MEKLETAKPKHEDFPKQEEFKCSYCQNIYSEPRFLDCYHTFCLKCLKSLAKKIEEKKEIEIQCPECKKTTYVQECIDIDKIAEYLSVNFVVIEKAKSLLKIQENMPENMPPDEAGIWDVINHLVPEFQNVACQICLNARAEVTCSICGPEKKFCMDDYYNVEKHLGAHRKKKENSIGIELSSTSYLCDKKGHNNNPKIIYCFKCKTTICDSCFRLEKEHATHEMIEISEMSKIYNKEMEEVKFDLQRKLDSILIAKECYHANLEVIQNNEKEITSKTLATLAEIRAVQEKENEIKLNEIKEIHQSIHKNQEQNMIELNSKQIQIEQILKALSPVQIEASNIDIKPIYQHNPSILIQSIHQLKRIQNQYYKNIITNPHSDIGLPYLKKEILSANPHLKMLEYEKIDTQMKKKGEECALLQKDISFPLSSEFSELNPENCKEHHLKIKLFCECTKSFLCSQCLMEKQCMFLLSYIIIGLFLRSFGTGESRHSNR